MTEEETRVVLVKPGDVLIFGNVGVFEDPEAVSTALITLRTELGIKHIVVFDGDIDMAVAKREASQP